MPDRDDDEWEDINEKDQTTPKGNESDDEDGSEYSDWEGITDCVSSPSILKRREFTELEKIWTLEEVEEAKANYVYPEKAAAVLKASLQKAMQAARRAAIFGFPEPSIYRDEDDPFGEDESDEDDKDYNASNDDSQDGDYESAKPKKKTKKPVAKSKQNGKGKRKN